MFKKRIGVLCRVGELRFPGILTDITVAFLMVKRTFVLCGTLLYEYVCQEMGRVVGG